MKSFDIKKLFTKLSTFKKLEFRSVSAKAHFDWKVMIILFFFVWIGIILYSTKVFFDVDKGTFFTTEKVEVQTTSIINKKTLDTVVKVFEEKNKKMEELKISSPSVADPSE